MKGVASEFRVIIPARLASTRLPGKALLDLGGAPMIVRVWQAAMHSGAIEVWVATDDERIVAAVEAAGGRALLTSPDHASGSARLAEVVERLGWSDETIVVNVQGDEPLIDPVLVRRVADVLSLDERASMATAGWPIVTVEEFLDPNVVKVVCDGQGRALYFSRAPIPWPRDAFASERSALPADLPARRHVGLYAYRAGFLRRFAALPASPLEGIEALEQLRALWHGHVIRVIDCEREPAPGVDTADDLARVRAMFAARAAVQV